MKKITLFASLLCIPFCSFGQNFYTFSASQGTYTALENPTSINNNAFWDWDEFDPIALPFTVQTFGEGFSHFMFYDDNFFLVNSESASFDFGENIDSYTILTPISAYIQDRDVTEDGSLSQISYKTVGETGNRILKLEIKNAGLEEEIWETEASTSYLNYQIWIYETTNKIEFHFGASLVEDIIYLNGDDYIYSLFGTETPNFFKATFLSGINNSPTYSEISDSESDPGIGLNSIPVNGQIYTFTTDVLSTDNENKLEFSLYPNPVINELNISLTEIANYNYEVFDILGKKVITGKANNVNEFNINTSNLNSGSYLLKVNNTIKKFIKK